MAGPLFFKGSAGVMEPDAPDVGRAEPADGPVVFYGRLEGFDGAILVGGGVAGAWGGGEEFDFGEIFFHGVVLLGGGEGKTSVGVGELVEGEAAVCRGVGHPVEVAVERLQGKFSDGFVCGHRSCMMCECVGRKQGARRRRGGGDAVYGNCCGHADKDVSPITCRALFAFERELMGSEGCFPRVPSLVGVREDIPVRALFGEDARNKEQAGGDRGKPHVGDGELCTNGLLLGVFEAVVVLGDARFVGPPAKHDGQEGDNVGGLEAAAAILEAVEEVAEGDLFVEGRFLLKGEDQRLLDDSLEECGLGAFDGLDKPLEFNLGGPEAFCLGADGVVRVAGNAVII